MSVFIILAVVLFVSYFVSVKFGTKIYDRVVKGVKKLFIEEKGDEKDE